LAQNLLVDVFGKEQGAFLATIPMTMMRPMNDET
jgi:hypothetical protein